LVGAMVAVASHRRSMLPVGLRTFVVVCLLGLCQASEPSDAEREEVERQMAQARQIEAKAEQAASEAAQRQASAVVSAAAAQAAEARDDADRAATQQKLVSAQKDLAAAKDRLEAARHEVALAKQQAAAAINATKTSSAGQDDTLRREEQAVEAAKAAEAKASEEAGEVRRESAAAEEKNDAEIARLKAALAQVGSASETSRNASSALQKAAASIAPLKAEEERLKALERGKEAEVEEGRSREMMLIGSNIVVLTLVAALCVAFGCLRRQRRYDKSLILAASAERVNMLSRLRDLTRPLVHNGETGGSPPNLPVGYKEEADAHV